VYPKGRRGKTLNRRCQILASPKHSRRVTRDSGGHATELSAKIPGVDPLRRAARLAFWTAGCLGYLWFAGVKNADRVKRRKAVRRRERLARRNVRPG
jgi:hypothetical protein